MKQTRPSFNFPYSRNHRQQRIGYHPSEPSSLGTPMGTMANPLYMVRVNGAGQVRPRSRNLNRPGRDRLGVDFFLPSTKIEDRSLKTVARKLAQPRFGGCGNGHRFRPAVQYSRRTCSLDGGVTASTGMDAARRHTGVHAPVIVCKTIIANNQQLAYAA